MALSSIENKSWEDAGGIKREEEWNSLGWCEIKQGQAQWFRLVPLGVPGTFGLFPGMILSGREREGREDREVRVYTREECDRGL